MVSSCYEKCIDKRFVSLTCQVSFCDDLTQKYAFRYKDGELNVGENSCIDRCSSKYWQVTGIVGQMLGAQGMQ